MAVAHLHVQSHYSFGRGTASPDALCAAAARRGVEALALTDLEGLYGAPEFVAAARRHGIHPVFGAAFPDASVPRSLGSGRAVVLARDAAGYGELCRLVARRHAEPHRPLERELEQLSDRVWVVSPDLSLLRAVARVRGTGYLAAELRAGASWMRLAEEAEALGVVAVGTAVVQLADASDRRFQRLLRAVHGKLAFARVGPSELASERGWMLDEGAVRAAFSRWPQAPDASLEVARDCRVGDLDDLVSAGFDVDGDAARRLRERALAGLRRKADAGSADLLHRLERELAVLLTDNRAPALLLLADLAEYGRANGLRLSALPPAAGSLVAWCLDLVPLDPRVAAVPFETLCNDVAGGHLHVDLRGPAEGRSALVEQLRRRLGDERVVTPGRFDCWSPKDAVRDVARSAALPPSECEGILRLIPEGWLGEGPEELLARYPRLRGAGIDQAPWDRILRAGARLAGRPRGLALGEGVVVGPGAVADRVPLQTVDGQAVAQWDRGGAQALGLLALRLPADAGASLLLRADPSPVGPELPPLEPLLRAAASGAVVGCPGLGTPERRRAVMRAASADLDGLLAAVAGVLPDAFAETRVADAARRAGLDDPQADLLLRRLRDPAALSARGPLRRRLVDGVRARGGSVVVAAELWDRLVAEVPGAPLRSAVLADTISALQVLALQERAPAALFAALLALGGDWPRAVFATEARRRGIELRRPCILDGPLETTGGDGVIELGLAQVRGVRDELCLLILAERREGGPFADLAAFVERVPGTVDEVDSLIAAGALDGLRGEHSRAGLRQLHRHLRPYRTRPRSGTRKKARPAPLPDGGVVPSSAAWAALLREELGALGFCVSGHPLHMLADEVAPGDGVAAGVQARRLGWLAAGAPGRGPVPADRRWWATFDTPEGLFDAALPDAVVRAAGDIAPGAWWVQGRLRREGGLEWIEASALLPAGARASWAKTA